MPSPWRRLIKAEIEERDRHRRVDVENAEFFRILSPSERLDFFGSRSGPRSYYEAMLEEIDATREDQPEEE